MLNGYNERVKQIQKLEKELEQEKEKAYKKEYFEEVASELQKENEKLKKKRYIYNAVTQTITEIPIDNNYICKNKIKDKIKEFDKPLLDIAEEQKFPFKYTLDGLSAIKDGVKKVLEDLLRENNNERINRAL